MTSQEIAKLFLIFSFGMLGVLVFYIMIQAKRENERINKKKLAEVNQNFDFMEPKKETPMVLIREMKTKAQLLNMFPRNEVYNPSKDQDRIKKGLEEDQFADPEKE